MKKRGRKLNPPAMEDGPKRYKKIRKSLGNFLLKKSKGQRKDTTPGERNESQKKGWK